MAGRRYSDRPEWFVFGNRRPRTPAPAAAWPPRADTAIQPNGCAGRPAATTRSAFSTVVRCRQTPTGPGRQFSTPWPRGWPAAGGGRRRRPGPAVTADWPTVSVLTPTPPDRDRAALPDAGPGVAFHPRGDRLVTALVKRHGPPVGPPALVERPMSVTKGRSGRWLTAPTACASRHGRDAPCAVAGRGQQDEASATAHRRIIGLTFSRDGRRLASWQDDATVRLGHRAGRHPCRRAATRLRLPSDVTLTAADRFWLLGWQRASMDAATGVNVAVRSRRLRAPRAGARGTRLVAMGDGPTGAWDIASGRQMATYQTAEKGSGQPPTARRRP